MATTTTPQPGSIDNAVDGLTIVDLLRRNAEKHPAHPAIHWEERGAWRNLTWSAYRHVVQRAAAGLSSLGVTSDDFVAIMAGNRPEHAIADLGAIHAGATGVTIYSTLTAEQIEYVAGNCEAKVAILEGPDFMAHWTAIRDNLPALTHIVMMEGAEDYTGDGSESVLSWDELLTRGDAVLADNPNLVDQASASIKPDTLATLIYTSGTTGTPKGVMISHRNVVWTAESVLRSVGELPAHPSMVSYLPLAHIAERMSTHYFGLYVTGEVYYCPELNSVLDYLQKAHPSLFVGVPRVWEKFHGRLLQRFEDNPKKDLINKALEHNQSVVRARNEGGDVGLIDKIKMAAFDRLIFSKVREQLGLDQVVISISSAAPIHFDLLVFFAAIGIPIYELYGMSETTGPATANTPDATRLGTVGRALPGVEVRIADDGEVLMKGGNISEGYYKLADETRETFDDDGWIHSGDLGRLDDGYLSIVGRKKEILITAAGKNIAPAKLEGLIRNHPLVAQACMVGDQRKFLTMLIGLDGESAPDWCRSNGVEFTDVASLADNETVRAEIQQAVDEANAKVAPVEQVKRFHIAPDEWTPESGELTPSLKLKRRVVLDQYSDAIEELYADV